MTDLHAPNRSKLALAEREGRMLGVYPNVARFVGAHVKALLAR